MPTATAKTFGQKNFTSIYGSMFLINVPGSLLTAGLAQFLGTLGFFWVIIIHTMFGVAGWIIAVSYNVKGKDGLDI
jgi:hypothetical protein